jgi:hypothetical protein
MNSSSLSKLRDSASHIWIGAGSSDARRFRTSVTLSRAPPRTQSASFGYAARAAQQGEGQVLGRHPPYYPDDRRREHQHPPDHQE